MKKIKTFFSRPSRIVLTVVCILIIVAAVGAGVMFAVQNSPSKKAAAEAVAYADAGVDASAAMYTYTELELEHGKLAYDVDFSANGIEYNYLIAASDHTILSRKVEVDDDQIILPSTSPAVTSSAPETTEVSIAPQEPTETVLPSASQAPQATSSPAQGNDIGLEAAQNIALNDAGFSAGNVTFTEGHFDYEDGVAVYVVEFYVEQTEYDYEIDAASGEIRKKSFDAAAIPATSSSSITVEQAKALALEHTGLTEADVSFTKAKLENDDGRTVYEIEFRQGTTEYEYTIDANTGNILEYDRDWNG